MSVYSQAYEAAVQAAADLVADLVSAGQELADAARRVAASKQVEPLDVLAVYDFAHG